MPNLMEIQQRFKVKKIWFRVCSHIIRHLWVALGQAEASSQAMWRIWRTSESIQRGRIRPVRGYRRFDQSRLMGARRGTQASLPRQRFSQIPPRSWPQPGLKATHKWRVMVVQQGKNILLTLNSCWISMKISIFQELWRLTDDMCENRRLLHRKTTETCERHFFEFLPNIICLSWGHEYHLNIDSTLYPKNDQQKWTKKKRKFHYRNYTK